MRPEVHDSAGSFRPDVRGIHRCMRDSEVYDDIVTTLSSTPAVNGKPNDTTVMLEPAPSVTVPEEIA